MCGTCDTAEALAVVAEAHRVASSLAAELLGEPVAKAMDLGTARGFDRAVASLAAELRRQAGRSERDAVRAAVDVLDVDWPRTTPAQRRQLVSEAMSAAGRATALIPARIQTTLGPAADEVVSATRSHARRVHGLAIGADFNAVDRRITAHVVRTQVNFVTDELGRRLDGFGAEARRIVACMDELAQDRRDAVRNAYLLGWSYAELASHFDVPLNTMRTWLRRSLIALRECMAR